MLMNKKNLIRHYFMLMAMLFVVSGSFVSNVMAADTDFEVICSGNTVKLVSISNDDNDNSISSPFTDCVFCHLSENEDLYNASFLSQTFASQSHVLKRIYLAIISNKTISSFYAQAPPHFS